MSMSMDMVPIRLRVCVHTSFGPRGDKALALLFAALLRLHGGPQPGACGVQPQLGILQGLLRAHLTLAVIKFL